MDTIPFAFQVGIALVSGLAIVCICGLFVHHLREIFGTFFALLLRPLLLINNSLEKFWRGVRDFYRGQFSMQGSLDLQSVFFQFIGATLYTLFFLAFIFSEFHLLALSLVAAGIDAGHFSPPIGAGALTAFAVIASILFFGAVICDLIGITKTAPWRESLNEKWRKYLLYVTFLSLGLSLFVTGSMGLFRGKIIADESLNPTSYSQSLPFSSGLSDSSTGFMSGNYGPATQFPSETTGGFYYWIPVLANIAIPILVLIGGVFSSWGLVTLIKFIMLMAGFIIMAPLGIFLIASNLFMNIIDRLYQFIDAIFQFIAAMGHRFMGLFGWKPPGPSQNGSQGDDSDFTDGEDKGGSGSCVVSQEKSNATQDDEIISPSQEGWKPFS